ncbi:hypothetical protein PS934_03260 [Pseudomonas fluorescens]|nr:hypothetical protein PS934_03260 [Pseudomonas fluorescens]
MLRLYLIRSQRAHSRERVPLQDRQPPFAAAFSQVLAVCQVVIQYQRFEGNNICLLSTVLLLLTLLRGLALIQRVTAFQDKCSCFGGGLPSFFEFCRWIWSQAHVSAPAVELVAQ